MKCQISHTALALFFGAILIAAPAIVGSKGLFAYDQAAADPGKGNGQGKGNGKSAGAKKSASVEEEEEEVIEVKKAKLASKLGALNAYHASPNAFKNASPNSRVGRIAAYWSKLQEAEVDGAITPEEQTELDSLLDAAANKPLDDETKEAFNQLLRDKFAEPEEEGEEETEE
jgi:hypothetical protein